MTRKPKWYSDHDLDIMARTLYGEAESGNESDARAIAHVILNRCDYPNWPDSPAEVCLQPWQFSCWNANDPGRARIAKASGAWFETCKEIAKLALDNRSNDPTHRSTHYYATYVKMPKWAKGKTPVYEVRHRNGKAHVFFNNIDTKPPKSAREALDQQNPVSASGTVRAARTGIAAGGVAGVLLENVEYIAPAMPFAETLAKSAPWVIVVILAAAIGYMVWRRIDDRKQGLR